MSLKICLTCPSTADVSMLSLHFDILVWVQHRHDCNGNFGSIHTSHSAQNVDNPRQLKRKMNEFLQIIWDNNLNMIFLDIFDFLNAKHEYVNLVQPYLDHLQVFA
jgi:hypothetical protein